MKDTSSTMAEEVPPPPFKLERELTLMPSEFRERLSASTRSRKSSAARSAARRSRINRHSATRVSRPPKDNVNSKYNRNDNENNNMIPDKNDNSVYYRGLNNNSTELDGSSRFYEVNQQMMPMSEHESILNEMERAYSMKTPPQNTDDSVKTPPMNLNIRDLMEPLDDWTAKEAIKEKKYAVLPSIGKNTPSPTKTDATSFNFSNSEVSEYSYSNQLDYGRDRMEQEADFFADFRINTSVVQPTPRQNPLPPIVSIKTSQNGGLSKTEDTYLRQLSATRGKSYKNADYLGINSLNARQMSGKHKSFKYL